MIRRRRKAYLRAATNQIRTLEKTACRALVRVIRWRRARVAFIVNPALQRAMVTGLALIVQLTAAQLMIHAQADVVPRLSTCPNYVRTIRLLAFVMTAGYPC